MRGGRFRFVFDDDYEREGGDPAFRERVVIAVALREDGYPGTELWARVR